MSKNRWVDLQRAEQLEAIKQESFQHPVMIFKHSTRCGTSAMTWMRLTRGEEVLPVKAGYYFLDLLAYRDLSNRIAEEYHVFHESPQVLMIHRGECVYDASHLEIRPEELASQAKAFQKTA